MEILQSALWKLGKSDIVKGAALLALTTAIGMVHQALETHGLSLGAYDWAGIWHVTWVAGLGYILKQMATAENGKLLGKI